MNRITVALLQNSPQYINALNERQLTLRGLHLKRVEQTALTNDEFDTLDLSDNEISSLDGFTSANGCAVLHRLRTLLIHNNHVASFPSASEVSSASATVLSLGEALPNLETLMLSRNNIKELKDLDGISSVGHTLLRLSLAENPVSARPHYRLYVIHLLPNLRQLDFNRVTPAERKQAVKMFGAVKLPAAPKKKSVGGGGNVGETGVPVSPRAGQSRFSSNIGSKRATRGDDEDDGDDAAWKKRA